MPGEPFPSSDPDTEEAIHRAPLARVAAELGAGEDQTEDERTEEEEALDEMARERVLIREEARRRFEAAGAPSALAEQAADLSLEPMPADVATELLQAAVDRERQLAGLLPKTVPETIVQLLERRLREARQETLARIVSTPNYSALSEHEKAELDALIFGVGYVCKGERIDPTTITIHQPPAHLHERFPAASPHA